MLVSRQSQRLTKSRSQTLSLSFSARLAATIAVALTVSPGCANWTASDSSFSGGQSALSELGQRSGAPVIEVSFVGLPMDSKSRNRAESIWQWVDETRVDAATRGRLLANGIRVGFVSNQDQFQRRLARESATRDVLDEFLSEASIQSDFSQGTERLPLRFGRRYELPLRQPAEGTQVTLVRIDQETFGQTLLRPQYLMTITANPGRSPNQIELQVRPEIQHGDLRQKYITGDAALRIEARRETWSLGELELDVEAGKNDLVVITADVPAYGLGKQMLTGSGSDDADQQVLLLLKVLQIPSRPTLPDAG